jgi:hypothetical protein
MLRTGPTQAKGAALFISTVLFVQVIILKEK